jgi:diaminopropionate ammonia-lyase
MAAHDIGGISLARSVKGDTAGAPEFLSEDIARAARRFHSGFPVYAETPLVRLQGLARELGLAEIYVKDESARFGLNSFKALGATCAVGRYAAQKLGVDLADMTYDRLVSDEVRAALGDITLVTATDGNHGRGVAWAARELRQKAIVYLPKGSTRERVERIRELGADASVTDLSYDEAVQKAADTARRIGGVLLQDTAWQGYEQIPTWIMQGYTTLGIEAHSQLPEMPTHIFLQAGVGSFAGAIAGLYANLCRGKMPIIIVVEPNKADCVFKTAAANDGALHSVTGEMDTIMAGLACGTPSTVGWSVLRDTADFYISCPDSIAVHGVRLLANPVQGDEPVSSGESGAVTLGVAFEIMQNPDFAEIRQALKLDHSSRVLCFSTEGGTLASSCSI